MNDEERLIAVQLNKLRDMFRTLDFSNPESIKANYRLLTIRKGIDKKYVNQIFEEKGIEIPKEDKKDFEVILENDLQNYEMEDHGWIIDKMIPSRAVGVWTGKRGSFKTFMVLSAVSSIASGKDFLGFKCEKGKVLYLDKENGIHIMKQRMPLIKTGLHIEEPLDIGFICFSQLKIDKIKDLMAIEEVIKEFKPSLFVVDTYRRGISFEENDAGSVSKLFVDDLRPLVEKYNMSIVLIHHDRKGESQGDEMDMIRGSSDLANYCDFILKNERRGTNLTLKQLKMRGAPEIEPIKVNMTMNNDTLIRFENGGTAQVITSEDQCAEKLILWINSVGLTTFTTNEARDVAFREGYRKQSFFNALNTLVENGIIAKEGRGKYKIVNS